MKRTTRSITGNIQGRALALQAQRVISKKTPLQVNKMAAEIQGEKYPSCLCCGNRGSSACKQCD